MPEPKSLSHTFEELATVYGITESLHIGENGTLRDDQDHIINPTELEVVKTFRFEGESNPSDMSILLVLRSKSDAQHSLQPPWLRHSVLAPTQTAQRPFHHLNMTSEIKTPGISSELNTAFQFRLDLRFYA